MEKLFSKRLVEVSGMDWRDKFNTLEKIIEEIDSEQKKDNKILYRFLYFPIADGQAVYQITNVKGRTATLTACDVGDAWTVPVLGEQGTMNIAKVKQLLQSRDNMDAMFAEAKKRQEQKRKEEEAKADKYSLYVWKYDSGAKELSTAQEVKCIDKGKHESTIHVNGKSKFPYSNYNFCLRSEVDNARPREDGYTVILSVKDEKLAKQKIIEAIKKDLENKLKAYNEAKAELENAETAMM